MDTAGSGGAVSVGCAAGSCSVAAADSSGATAASTPRILVPPVRNR